MVRLETTTLDRDDHAIGNDGEPSFNSMPFSIPHGMEFQTNPALPSTGGFATDGNSSFMLLADKISQVTEPKEQNALYTEFMTAVRESINRICADERLLGNYIENLQFEKTPPGTARRMIKKSNEFAPTPQLNDGNDMGRKEGVVTLQSPPDMQEVKPEFKNRMRFFYHTARDLWGPIISTFASDIYNYYRNRNLQGAPPVIIGMRRDFDVFGKALHEFGIEDEHAFLTRRMFMNPDVFDATPDTSLTDDDVRTHFENMALYLRQIGLTTQEDVIIMDSGAWGTLATEWILLRSALSYLSTHGLSDSTGNFASYIKSLPPETRFDKVIDILPPTFKEAIEVVTDPKFHTQKMPQPEKRKLLWRAVFSDDKLFDFLDGRELKTAAVFFYSHQHDAAYRNLPQRKIASWLHFALPGVDDKTLEAAADTMEEVFQSKWKGPTQFKRVEGTDAIKVILEPDETDVYFAASAAKKGTVDGVDLWRHRHAEAAESTPLEFITHFKKLQQQTLETDEFAGGLPFNTATWVPGKNFIENAWSKMVEFPESTYYEIKPEELRTPHVT